MAKKIKGAQLVFEVTDDGSLKLLEGKLKGAKKATDNLSKSEATLNRNFKGASQQSSNTTKNFSKMAQGITGGLVPAYATLAANIFAITAAFRFLQDAANYRILIQGQREYATITGESLKLLTSSLQAATGQQLAFAEAAQSVAIARAAGLTGDQINRLGVVARNASIALGRDLTDSLNRLIRGTTKAEPELLDELGIILRLEVATQKYADSIGKTKDQLTIFEKSQAVVNEVLAQGEEKFGEFNTTLNEFTLLAKSFDDLINDIKSGLTGVAEFIARGLTNSILGLTGAFALLGSGILRAITPQVPNIDIEAGATAARKNARSILNKAGRAKFGNLETDAQIKAFERSMNAQRTKFSKVEQSKRAEIAKTTAVIKAHNKVIEMDSANSFAKMGARWKVELFTMEAAYGKFLGRLKFAGLMFSRLITSVGWIGLFISAISVLSQFSEKLKSVETKQFEARLEKTLDVLKEQNAEITRLNENLQDTQSFLAKVNQLAKFVSNFNFTGLAEAFGGTVNATGISTPTDSRQLFQLSAGQQEILERTVTNLQQLQSKVQPGTKAFDELQTRIEEFTTALEQNNQYIGEGGLTSEAITSLGNSLRDIGKDGAFAAMGITKFANASALLANSAQEYSKALSSLRAPSGGLSTVSNAMGNFGATLFGVGTGKLEDTFKLGQEGGFDKLIDSATGEALKQFIGEKAFSTIVSNLRPTTEGLFGKKGNEMDIITALGAAAMQVSKRLADMEIRHATAKVKIETETLSLVRGRSKLEAGQIQKEQKVVALQTEKLNIEERIRELEAQGLTQNAATIAKEQANLNNVTQKLKNAQDEADLLHQVSQTFKDSFATGMTQMFQSIIEGTKSIKDAFKDMTMMILKSLAQILAQQAALQIMSFIPGLPGVGGRYGGVMSKTGRSFAQGGVPSGPESGYPVTLHGTEAVVPLGNDRHIPVKFENGGSSAGAVTVNVNMTSGETETTGEDQFAFGKAIASAVQQEIAKQQRPGGTLSPY